MKKLLLIMSVFIIAGCQVEPNKLTFRPPLILEETNETLPKIKFASSQQLKAFYAREVNGMSEDYLLKYFVGSPHLKIQLDDYESWVYYFQRVRPGLRPPHDVRQIKNMSGNPPNLAVALSIQDNKVTMAHAPWFSYVPVSVSDTERFFGKPDKRLLGTGGEEFYYRFVCFTSFEGPQKETSYILNEAVLKIVFSANGNYYGYDLFLIDRSKVVIFPDNTVQDPAMNIVWKLRRPVGRTNVEKATNGTSETNERESVVNLITYRMNGLDKPGEVAAAFGWPSYQESSKDGRIKTDIYPLKRAGSPLAFMMITAKAVGDKFEVVSLAMKWVGGMPKTPQELRIKFGEPDRIFGSVASGFQKYVYNYRLSVEPFIKGHPKKFQYGISIVFSIRSGVNLLNEVEIRKITF